MRRPGLAAVLLLCTLLPACGTSDVEERNAYVREVNAARADFDRGVAEVTARLGETSTPERTREALAELEDTAATFEQRLRVVRAPEAVADVHDRLVAQVSAYGDEFDRAQTAFETSDPNRYLEARTELQQAVAAAGERLNAVIDELNAALQR